MFLCPRRLEYEYEDDNGINRNSNSNSNSNDNEYTGAYDSAYTHYYKD